jgi:hypothetical protein
MAKLQFRVLYRQFLFRIVDLELLSAKGDSNELLGRFGGLLAFLSLMFLFAAMVFDDRRMPPAGLLIVLWNIQHALIATTMLVVGIFAVLSWDSTFPDRRDVLILTPLPVRVRTLFLAKVSALAAALAVTVFALHVFAGISWPFRFIPSSAGRWGPIRSFAAYWITMLSAGAFIFCSVLTVQGLAAQVLSRRRFLLWSTYLQTGAFCLFLGVYFLQPSLATPKALTAPENQQLLAWLPSYWFLGLFQELNRSTHPALSPLAQRALVGLAVALLGACTTFVLSYFRTLRKIVEEPDIAPGSSHRMMWTPRLGSSLTSAIVLFVIRTFLRSRQHRAILAFYLGVGFAVVIAYTKTRLAQRQVYVPAMVSSIVMMFYAVLGSRVAFGIPLDLRANWIFRMTEICPTHSYLAAVRRSLFVLTVAPISLASTALFLWMFLPVQPWRVVLGHLAVLTLLGIILADLSLYSFRKIPFTCSYLPGKTDLQLAFWFCALLLVALTDAGARHEYRALQDPVNCALMLGTLGAIAGGIKWRTAALDRSPETELQFDDVPSSVILGLNLRRDGVPP